MLLFYFWYTQCVLVAKCLKVIFSPSVHYRIEMFLCMHKSSTNYKTKYLDVLFSELAYI